jgi:3-dehydroquinate dehydratase-1
MKTPFIVGTLHSELCLKMLSRIFNADHLRKPGSQMDAALDSYLDLDSIHSYSSALKYSSALPHQPSRPPRHNPYEISGLKKNPRELFYKIDLLEARLDSLPLSLLPSWWPLPVIATARHHAEGGVSHLSTSQRQHLLEESLAWACAIDVEWRSLKKFTSLIATAKKEKRFIISSFHDFKTVPSLARLERMSLLAQEAGADLFKVACRVTHEHELLRLLAFQSMMPPDFPIACMGMGEGGKLSRILLPLCGSWLSYGWLYKPQLSGQWSAEDLALLSRKFW